MSSDWRSGSYMRDFTKYHWFFHRSACIATHGCLGVNDCVLRIPLLKGILIAHGRIATSTNRNQIVDTGFSSPTLGDVMTDVEIKGSYLIPTPGGLARCPKLGAVMAHPYLLTQCLGDLCLHCIASSITRKWIGSHSERTYRPRHKWNA
jgi:hypothetical protein